ncbi:hypothetical protein QVD99_006110 [Batrachochytrium dendrobatidis]|nr:hypothetical protein O5D80_006298 [Batrachochytrium dendrobatidis]KAK5667521.1 hypothetical protein QVD99_006110 [Batrachochytrium dendrobatidis]
MIGPEHRLSMSQTESNRLSASFKLLDNNHRARVQVRSDLEKPNIKTLRKDEKYLSDMVKEYEQKLSVELMLKSSAEVMAKIHSDKASRQKAENEIQFAYRRIELISGELVKLVSRFRIASRVLCQAEIQAIRETLAFQNSTQSDNSFDIPTMDLTHPDTSFKSENAIDIPIVSNTVCNNSISRSMSAKTNGVASDLTMVQSASPTFSFMQTAHHHSSSIAMIGSLQKTIQAKDAEIQALNLQLKTAQLSTGLIKTLTSDPVDSSSSHASLVKEVTSLRESLSALSKSSSDMVMDLNISLAQCRQEKSSLAERLKISETNYYSTRQQYIQVHYEAETLKTQYLQCGMDPQHLNQIRNEANVRSVSEVSQLQLKQVTVERDTAMANLQNLTTKQESHSANIIAWKKSLNEELQRKLAIVESALLVARANEKVKMDEYKAKISELDQVCQQLQSQIDENRDEHSSIVSKLQETITLLTKEQVSQQNMSDKGEQTDELIFNSDVHSDVKKTDEFAVTKDMTNQHYLEEQLEHAHSQVGQLQSTFDSLEIQKHEQEQSITKLEIHINDLQTRLDHLTLEKTNLEKHIAQLTHSLSEAQANEELSVQTVCQIQARNEAQLLELQEMVDSMGLEIRSEKIEKRHLSDQLASMNSELQNMTTKLNAANQQALTDQQTKKEMFKALQDLQRTVWM